jgi:cytoskeletal protein CcmA (bactofilin family)
LTSWTVRIARAPAEEGGGERGGAPGGPRAQRPLVPGIPSRRVDPSGVVTQHNRHLRPGQQPAARSTVAEQGELVVGQGITVKGGINNCRRLVVHGTVQATVPAEALEIGPDGVFEGRAQVREATVAGRFDGDLVVDGTLTVAPGGLIKGRVRYRTLSVESGGHVRAEIDHVDTADLPVQETTAEAAQPAPGRSALEPATSEPAPSEPATSEPAPSEPAPSEPATSAPSAPEADAADTVAAGAAATTDASVPEAAAERAGETAEGEPAAPRVPTAFSGLPGLMSAVAERSGGPARASDDASAEGQAVKGGPNGDETAPADVPEDADEDAERFYRSLARTGARA